MDAYLREQQEKEIEKYKASSSSPSEENEVSVSVKNSSYNSSSCVIIRQEVTKLLRDTALIEDRDLSYEVHLVRLHLTMAICQLLQVFQQGYILFSVLLMTIIMALFRMQ